MAENYFVTGYIPHYLQFTINKQHTYLNPTSYDVFFLIFYEDREQISAKDKEGVLAM